MGELGHYGRVGSWRWGMGHGPTLPHRENWPLCGRVGRCNDNLFFFMTIVIQMFIIKLFLFFLCAVSILPYLYRHTLCDPTLPGMAQVSPNMSPHSLGELGQENIFF